MFKAKYHSSILFWDFNLINFIPSRIFHFSLSTSLIQTKHVYTFSLLLSLFSPCFQVTSPLPPLATVSSFISLLQINLGKVWFAFINSTCSPVLNAQLTTIPLTCSCKVTATSLWGPASEPTCCPFSSSPWFPQHCTLLVFLLPHFFSSPLLATLQLLLFSAFCTMGLVSLGIGNLSHIYRGCSNYLDNENSSVCIPRSGPSPVLQTHMYNCLGTHTRACSSDNSNSTCSKLGSSMPRLLDSLSRWKPSPFTQLSKLKTPGSCLWLLFVPHLTHPINHQVLFNSSESHWHVHWQVQSASTSHLGCCSCPSHLPASLVLLSLLLTNSHSTHCSHSELEEIFKSNT